MALQRRAALVVSWITLFLMGTDLFVVSPLLPFISEEYKISSAMAGWMVTAFAVTYAVAAPFWGWLSDKKGRRKFIPFGLLIFTFSNMLTAYASSFSWLIASRVLVGFSVASITPLIYAIIGDVAPQSRKGAWLSIVVSGHLTALWAGAPLGALVEQFLGWRSVFVVMAITGAILAIANFKIWASLPKNHSTRNLVQGNMLRILGAVSVTTIWAISMYALYVYLGVVLYSEINFTASEIALAIAFYGVGAVLGSLTSGQLTDTFGARKISTVSLLFLTLTFICLGIFFSLGYWIYPLLFIWALVGYAGFTSYQARLAGEYPQERGIVMAWNNTALYIGITIGSMVGGYVITNWSCSLLPYVCSAIASTGFILSKQKKKAG